MDEAAEAAPLQPGDKTLMMTTRHGDPYALFSSFLASGLAADEKLYLALHNNISLDMLGRALREVAGQNVESWLEHGRLALLHAPDLYLSDGTVDLRSVRLRLQEIVDKARAEGYAGARLIMDLVWARDFGAMEEIARASARIGEAMPPRLSGLDVCYAEDITADVLRGLIAGYAQVYFKNGAASLVMQRAELERNDELLVLLLGALTDTSALVRANRDAAFLDRVSAAISHKTNANQIAAEALELCASYFHATLAVIRGREDPDRPDVTQTACIGVDAAAMAAFADTVGRALAAQPALLVAPRVLAAPHAFFDPLPRADIRVLVIIPLIDEHVNWGFLVLGGRKPSFAAEINHNLLVSLSRAIGSAYRRHFEMRSVWSAGAGRFDSVRVAGEMIAGIAHGFLNRLAVISASAQLIRAQAEAGATADLARRIDLSVKDVAEMVRGIQTLLGGDVSATETVSLSDLVQQAAEITRPRWETQAHAKGTPIRLQTDLRASALVQVKPSIIREAISNLIINACEALAAGGEIRLTTWDEPGRACLSVWDSGAGVDPRVAASLFQPFTSTKSAGNSGLGLTVARRSVTDAGGTLNLETSAPSGTAFVMTLPRVAMAAGAVEDADVRHAVRRLAGRTIIVVDDDDVVRETLAKLFELGGAAVATCATPQEALERMAHRSWDLVLTDLAMPGMTGLQLASAARERHPQTFTVLLTGWVDPLMEAEARRVVELIVLKPLTAARIDEIADLFDRPSGTARE